LSDVAARLRAPYSEKVFPSSAAAALAPFYPNVRRCTSPEHRLLVVGLIPSVLYFAQRPFAGGQSVLALYTSDARQRSIVRALMRQVVPFVVIAGRRYANDFDAEYPIVAEWVRARYAPLATLGDDYNGARILIDRGMAARPPDPETGWPCLSGR
jgi:hypothetical protein